MDEERERETEGPFTVVALAFGGWRCGGKEVVGLGGAGVEGCGCDACAGAFDAVVVFDEREGFW